MTKKVLLIRSFAILIAFLVLLAVPTSAMAIGHLSVRVHRVQEDVLMNALPKQQAETLEYQITEEQARYQGGIAAAISGLLALTFLLRKRLSLQQTTESAAQALKNYTLPPQALAPGLAAHLCGSSSAALATLFDLAQRGFLRIEEREAKWGQSFFEIVRLPARESLQPHEETFLDALFPHPKKDRVSLSQFFKLSHSISYQKALDDELILRGWYSVERVDQRRQFAILSGVVMVIGLLLFAIGIGVGWNYSFGAILIGSGGSLIFTGLVGLILTLSLPALTDEGAMQAAQWKAFASFLKEIILDQHQRLSPEILDRYLPYAAGFGFLDEWVSYFFRQSKVNVPEWFARKVADNQPGMGDAFAALISNLCAESLTQSSVNTEIRGILKYS